MAAWYAPEFQHAGIGAGDSNPVPRADRAGSRDRVCQRGQSGGADLVGPSTSLVPLLRSQRGSYNHGSGGKLSPGVGFGARGFPGHVWNPPLLQVVLWTDGGNLATGDSGQSCGRGGVSASTKVNSREGGIAAPVAHATLFLWDLAAIR